MMKNINKQTWMGLLLFAASPVLAQNTVKTLTVKISNPAAEVKTDEPVVINLQDLKLNWEIK